MACLPSSQDQRAANLLRTFPLASSDVILQHRQRSSSILPCRLVLCELACLLYQDTCYWKAEPRLPGASLCLKSIEGRLNSLSDHIPSQFPYFCPGNYHLSFLPDSEILPHPSPVSYIPSPGSGLPSNCLSDSSRLPHSNCPTVIQPQPFTT